MKVGIDISPKLVLNVASLYTDPYRVYMEYIDNSIDSAEDFYDSKNEKYLKKIRINILIKGSSKSSGKIIITDNCTGMDQEGLANVVNSIGNSNKTAEFTKNGQFGFGVYSFLSMCERAEIISSKNKNSAEHVILTKKHFEHSNKEDSNVELKDYHGSDHSFESSGTTVILDNFNSWSKNEYEILIKNIENHFEGLLHRENIEIKVVHEKNGMEYECKPMDYDEYEGDQFEEMPEYINYISNKRRGTQVTIRLMNNDIKTFIKFTKGKAIDRPVVILNKGRRISEIYSLKSFRSHNKGSIWRHQNITGFIEIDGFLEPTISRDDFKRNDNKLAFFGYLEAIEEEIKGLIEKINEERQKNHYHNLENKLNKVMSQVAKNDIIAMKFRTESLSGTEIPLKEGDINKGEEGSVETREFEGRDPDGKGVDPKNTGKKRTGKEDGSGEQFNNEEDPFADNLAGKKNKKSGFNIEITNNECMEDREGKFLRSALIGDSIVIYKKHPDFEKRISHSQKGRKHLISQRLVTYLAGEMTIHYKNTFHNKHSQGQPEYKDWMFRDLTDTIYFIEDALAPLVNENLSTFSDDK